MRRQTIPFKPTVTETGTIHSSQFSHASIPRQHRLPDPLWRLFSALRQQNPSLHFSLSLHAEINGSEKGLVNPTDENQLWHEKSEANI